MSGPEVSVVVAVRDDAAGLARLLVSLDGQTLPRARFEVVVVANACRDASAATARAHGARVVEEPTPGRARARNLGVQVARANRIAFTDADCVAEPSWLAALLACAGTAPLLAGPVTITTTPAPNAVERFEALWRFGQESWVTQGWAATANLLVDRAAFAAVGGFDTAYRHIGEDADLCLRAGRAGFALGYCPAARVTHPAECRLAPMLKRAFWHGAGSAQVLRRIGVGERAWQHPRRVLHAGTALAAIGHVPDGRDPAEARRMARLARGAHAARIAGSVWGAIERGR